jgi:hypothetical protein
MSEILSIIDKAKLLAKDGVVPVILTYHNGGQEQRRIGLTGNNDPIVLNKGSKKRGRYLNSFDLSNIELVIKNKTSVATKWVLSVKKAIKLLEASGLWVNVLADLKLALSLGYEKIKDAHDTYWRKGDVEDYNAQERLNLERIKSISPLLVKTNDKGVEYARTDILFYMSEPLEIKKMYFGKYANERCLSDIHHYMTNKVKGHVSGTSSYDVSFEYDPISAKAWYSEEYRGCGNGHYYLALNGSHAMFYEDD